MVEKLPRKDGLIFVLAPFVTGGALALLGENGGGKND